MGLPQLLRSLRGNLFTGQPALAIGEIPVWSTGGQLLRSRQVAGPWTLGPAVGSAQGVLELLPNGSGQVQLRGGRSAQQIGATLDILAEGNGVSFGGALDIRTGNQGSIQGTVRIQPTGGYLQLLGAGGPGGQRLGLWGATPIEQGAPTTSAQWDAYLKALGLVGSGAVFPSGGAAGISNPTGSQIQVGDIVYTSVLLGRPGTGCALFVRNDLNDLVFEINGANVNIGSGNENVRINPFALGYFGQTPQPRINISAAYAALPALGTMNAAYSQAQANHLLAALRGILDALGNASGHGLVQTV